MHTVEPVVARTAAGVRAMAMLDFLDVSAKRRFRANLWRCRAPPVKGANLGL
jgi:hypothetical protein